MVVRWRDGMGWDEGESCVWFVCGCCSSGWVGCGHAVLCARVAMLALYGG